ncbi:MAG: hypothetical protein AAB263_15160 [Planctomycetota bacterium]
MLGFRFTAACVLAVLSVQILASEGPPTTGTTSPPKPTETAQPFTCTITCKETTVELGKAPTITVAITNLTKQEAVFVGSLDGSESKLRFPHYGFTVIDATGKDTLNMGFRMCGNTNALREADFVKIATEKSFNPYANDAGFFGPYGLNKESFSKPGIYRVTLRYSGKNDDIKQWAGDSRDTAAADVKLAALFKQVPKLELTSNTLTITVVAPPAVIQK